MKKMILVSLLSFVLVGTAQAQEDAKVDPYEKAVQRILELSQAENTMKVMIPQLFDQLRQKATGVPNDFWDASEQKFLDQVMAETQRIMVPLYREHFTLEDLQGLIQFYESPLGQKMTTALPEITQKAMQDGQQWGMRVMQEMIAEMREKGYL
jgi:hypothetical protein